MSYIGGIKSYIYIIPIGALKLISGQHNSVSLSDIFCGSNNGERCFLWASADSRKDENKHASLDAIELL